MVKQKVGGSTLGIRWLSSAAACWLNTKLVLLVSASCQGLLHSSSDRGRAGIDWMWLCRAAADQLCYLASLFSCTLPQVDGSIASAFRKFLSSARECGFSWWIFCSKRICFTFRCFFKEGVGGLQLRQAWEEELGSILCLFVQDSLPPGSARSCSCLPGCCVIPACNKLVCLPAFWNQDVQ